MSYPPIAERQAALRETIEIVRGLWGGAPFTFDGDHFRVADAEVRIGPVQQPRVPLLIAGGGERVTLRQVALYADACNFGPSGATGNAWGLEDVRRKYAVLREHCALIGRPFESVLRTFHSLLVMAGTDAGVQAKLDARVSGGPRVEAARAAGMPREIHTYFDMPGLEKVPLRVVAGTPEQVTAYYRLLVDAGVQYIIVPGRDAETVRLLAEHVMPHFNDS